MSQVLVTGASGNVGRQVVRALAERGISFTPSGPPGGRLEGGVVLDFHNRSTWTRAIAGHTQLFLMRPPAIADVEKNINPFVDQAFEQGIRHVVFLSVAGAGKNSFVPHRKVEDHLRARGYAHTNLRPGFFAQNLQTAYLKDIVNDSRLYVPAGNKPVNWIDVADVADVAALIFGDPKPHTGENYTLTGPGAVSWQHVAQVLSQALGRSIRYEPASLIGYVLHLKRRGLPAGAIAVQTILHALLRLGQGDVSDPALVNLLGRNGRSIDEYIRANAEIWAVPSGPAG